MLTTKTIEKISRLPESERLAALDKAYSIARLKRYRSQKKNLHIEIRGKINVRDTAARMGAKDQARLYNIEVRHLRRVLIDVRCQIELLKYKISCLNKPPERMPIKYKISCGR